MKSLLEYIQESKIDNINDNINEGFFDSVKKFFKWLTSSDEEYNEHKFMYSRDDIDDIDDYIDDNFSTDNVVSETYDKPKQFDIIKNLISKVKSNVKKKTGFWIAKEDLDKEPAYANIESAPWFIKYVTFTYKVDEDHIIDPCGLMCYSKNFNSLPDGNKDYENYIHILSVQTLKRYKGHHLFKKCYIPYFKKMAENNPSILGVTLRPYDEKLKELYLRYGFIADTKDPSLLIKRF